jgi:hypothetical protein
MLLNLAPFSPLFSAVSFLPCLPFLPSHLFTSLSSFLLPLLLTSLLSLFSSLRSFLSSPLFSSLPSFPFSLPLLCNPKTQSMTLSGCFLGTGYGVGAGLMQTRTPLIPPPLSMGCRGCGKNQIQPLQVFTVQDP